MSFLFSLAEALVLTILSEFAVYLALVKRNWRELLAYSVLINSFTNPLLNYVYIFELHNLYLLEVAIILIESLLIAALMEMRYPKALALSSAANLASFLSGLFFSGLLLSGLQIFLTLPQI